MSKKKYKKISALSIEKWRREEKKRMKSFCYRNYMKLYRLFWRIIRLPREIKLEIKSFYQRGKRGWSDRDTWGLCYHLADVIHETIYHLKEIHHGHPGYLTEGKWIDILNEIIDTFYIAQQIANDRLFLIEDREKREKWQKTLNEINKEHKTNDRCMTDEEIIKYKKGWKLFQKYFYHLWD